MTMVETRPAVSELCADLLESGVDHATAGRYAPRIQQWQMAESISDALEESSITAIAAPVGSGKSLGYLAPSAERAADCGERTLIVTNTLTLQDQLLEKDIPSIQYGLRSQGRGRLTAALFKGKSNYLCRGTALNNAAYHFDLMPQDSTEAPELDRVRDALAASLSAVAEDDLSADAVLLRLFHWALFTSGPEDRDRIGLASGQSRSGAELLGWPEQVDEQMWQQVSLGREDGCPKTSCSKTFGVQCAQKQAKDRAQEAAVVVVNQSQLAMNVGQDIPVIFPSGEARGLGDFHNVIVDEAHHLADAVRDKVDVSVSGQRITDLAKAVQTYLDGEGYSVSAEQQEIFDELLYFGAEDVESTRDESRLRRFDQVVNYWLKLDKKLTGDDQLCLDDLAVIEFPNKSFAQNSGWYAFWENMRDPDDTEDIGYLNSAAHLVLLLKQCLPPRYQLTDAIRADRERLKKYNRLRRLYRRMENLATDLKKLNSFAPGSVRWAQPAARSTDEHPRPVLRRAKVDVSQLITSRLYTGRGVALLSGTLSQNVAEEVGFLDPGGDDDSTSVLRVDSPYRSAFAESALLLPVISDQQHSSLFTYYPDTKSFDLNRVNHRSYVTQQALELISANGGSAMVISATRENADYYLRHLSNVLPGEGIAVYSALDSSSRNSQIAKWRADESSVIVGTRSLTTGVDAPGETNTLVILDRVARDRPNVLTDARAQRYVDREEGDAPSKWAVRRAKNSVYLADAAATLAQSVGRLVRSPTDTGMVAVLDPRHQVESYRGGYGDQTKRHYYNVFEEAGLLDVSEPITDVTDAAQWLRRRQQALL